jgi:nucleotide-binding universal stress UspA family protein
MPFENIIVPIDGSESSRIAADYGFWFSTALAAKLSGQHVIDPKLTEVLFASEVLEELGIKLPLDASDKLLTGQKRIALLILDLFKKQSLEQSVGEAQTCIDVGSVTANILKRAGKADLVILGHHGKGQQGDDDPITGSIASRIATESECSVLLARQPIQELGPILLAYDGSATANGALVMAERLAVSLRKELKVIHIAPNKQQFPKAKLLMQKAATHLTTKAQEYGSAFDNGKQFLDKVVFMLREGNPAETLVDFARMTNGLLVAGATGARPKSHRDLFGKTASYILRNAKTSILIYREQPSA